MSAVLSWIGGSKPDGKSDAAATELSAKKKAEKMRRELASRQGFLQTILSSEHGAGNRIPGILT